MGYATAAGFAEAVKDGGISLKGAINAHRISNLFPVPPVSMLDLMVAAVEAVQQEESDILLALPEGLLWDGDTHVPAFTVIEAFRLDAFV